MSRRKLRAGVLEVEIELIDDRLSAVNLPSVIPDGLEPSMLADLLEQLDQFPLELPESGPFTRKVWEQMRKIPAGSALTYRELAKAAGNPGAVRAVGQACAKNQLPLAVPCHRVVAEDGLGGFSLGLDWKRKLLELEIDFV